MKVCELNSYPWCCWCCEDVVDTGVRSSSWNLSLVASVVMQEEARIRQLHNSISPPCNHTTTHFNPDHRLLKTGNLHIIKLINPDNPQCFQPELVSKKTFNKTFFRTTVAQTLLNNCVIKWVHSREFLENSENIQFTVGHVGTHYFNCCCTETKYVPLNINCTLSNTKFCRFCSRTKNLIESLKCFLWRGTSRLQWLLQCLIDHQDCHSQHCDLWWSAHYWVLHHSSLSQLGKHAAALISAGGSTDEQAASLAGSNRVGPALLRSPPLHCTMKLGADMARIRFYLHLNNPWFY